MEREMKVGLESGLSCGICD